MNFLPLGKACWAQGNLHLHFLKIQRDVCTLKTIIIIDNHTLGQKQEQLYDQLIELSHYKYFRIHILYIY